MQLKVLKENQEHYNHKFKMKGDINWFGTGKNTGSDVFNIAKMGVTTFIGIGFLGATAGLVQNFFNK